MTLHPGTRLGAYEILAPLGAGGMGEVWRARDSRLGRDVAIKVIPAEVAADPERIARFEREARLLASLRHPNVATLYGLENAGGQHFIVMECVEGASLAQRLAGGPLPVAEALDLGRQAATGLEAAHEGGIVHRDLKPANVMVTPAGEVRLLDFGLAKGDLASSGSVSDYSHSPTLTGKLTGANVILGTAAYMSPEQARGKPVDRRTDIWSFGVMLYECLTGRQCFAGETLSDTIAMILQRDPDWSALPAGVPRRVRELLARCLERDPRKRLRDAGEARIALETALADLESGAGDGAGPVPGRPARGRTFAIASATLVAGVALGWLAARAWWAPGPGPRVVRYAIEPPGTWPIAQAEFMSMPYWDVASDGSRVVIGLAVPDTSRQPRLYTRRLADSEWRAVRGSERALGQPRLADDGRTVYFVSRVSDESDELRVLKVNSDEDGSAEPVCEAPEGAVGMAILPGRRLLFVHSDELRIAVHEPGSSTAPEWKAVERGGFRGSIPSYGLIRSPHLGRDELFVGTTLYSPDGWHQGTALLDVRTRKLTPVLVDGQYAHLPAPGALVYSRGTRILAIRYDARARATRGEAVPLLDGVRTRGQWLPGRFAITSRGDLCYSPGGAVGEKRALQWLSARGEWTPFAADRAFSNSPGSSADGRRVAISITNARGFDEIWGYEGDDHVGQRLAQAEGADVAWPVISADGLWMAFHRQGVGAGAELLVRPFASDDEPIRLFQTPRADSLVRALDWFPDDRHLLFKLGVRGAERLYLADRAAESGAPRLRPVLPAWTIESADVSPDGRLLVFDSDRSGRYQVYACPISTDGTSGTPVLLARAGRFPVWASDGRSIYYLTGLQNAVSRQLQVSTAGAITPGSDRTVFELGEENARIRGGVAIPDGRALCVLAPVEDPELSRVKVVQDWWSSVQRRLPR